MPGGIYIISSNFVAFVLCAGPAEDRTRASSHWARELPQADGRFHAHVSPGWVGCAHGGGGLSRPPALGVDLEDLLLLSLRTNPTSSTRT